MPYRSSVCTAISTSDNESMSRSSTNAVSAVTSERSIPVISSMISSVRKPFLLVELRVCGAKGVWS